MATGFKFVTPDMTTHNGCRWEVGVWKEVSGEGELCGPGWLHCYDDPLLATLSTYWAWPGKRSLCSLNTQEMAMSGKFKKGFDIRRHIFTPSDQRKGYRNAPSRIKARIRCLYRGGKITKRGASVYREFESMED